jgi:HK97 family phage prohead protease
MSPYPNEHSCRLLDPDQFVRFFRKHVKDEKDVGDYKATGKPYDLLIGYRQDESSDTQAHRYAKDTWTEAEARKHCQAHKGKSFEPASEENVATPDREVRTFHTELRVDGGEADPVIVGRSVVYNQPSVNLGFIETIEVGFFEGALEGDTRALFNHDSNYVLGRRPAGTLELQDGSEGLDVQIRPPKTALINDLVLEPMRRGDIDQMSFQWRTKPDGDVWRVEGSQMYRTLKRGGCAELYDVSVVTFPAYPQTSAQVRSKVIELQSQIHSTGDQKIPVEEPAQTRHAHRRRRLQLKSKL